MTLALVDFDQVDLGVEVGVDDIADPPRVILGRSVLHKKPVLGGRVDEPVLLNQSAVGAADLPVFVVDNDVTAAAATDHLVRNDQILHL
jgi:hypothetical protein